MTNSKTIFHDLVNRISTYDKGEAYSIAYRIMEHVFGLSQADIVIEKPIAPEKLLTTEEIVNRINQHEPVQYILGHAEFFGRKFMVNPSVLIPRPETEELVTAVLSMVRDKHNPIRILDIGTGSGCIAVTLALEIPDAELWATDVSEEALNVARKNAEFHKAKVTFVKHNILDEPFSFGKFTVLVSNPPYVAEMEKSSLQRNVVNYEPHLALFVKDNDPLLFYKTIGRRSKELLNAGGLIAVEINERLGNETAQLFKECGIEEVEVVKDISGKDRIVTGVVH